MIARKICLLGAGSVGKSSLVRRFVRGVYSDWYSTTVGVKINRTEIVIGGKPTNLILWDVSGEDELTQLETRFLRGAAGLILVADRARSDTFDKAAELDACAVAVLGAQPRVLALNKADLDAHAPTEKLDRLQERGVEPLETSAKTGYGVESLFAALAGKLDR